MDKYMVLFGLDKPLHVQFYKYITETFKGNLGVSFMFTPRTVSEILLSRLYNTLILLVPATIGSILLGMLLGIISSWKRGTKTDLTLQIFSILFWSMPTFWLGMIFIVFFGRTFSTGGMVTAGLVHPDFLSYLNDLFRHMFLPSLTLMLIMHGQYFLVMRSQLTDVSTENFMLTAKAKGLTSYRILRHHGVPNAMLPMITLISLNLAFLVAGFITIETVFSWPGLGELIYKAILFRDYPILQGAMLLLAGVMLGTSFIADILYAYLDPRIRYG